MVGWGKARLGLVWYGWVGYGEVRNRVGGWEIKL